MEVNPLPYHIGEKQLVRRFSWTDKASDEFRALVALELDQIERLILCICGAFGLYRSGAGKSCGICRRLVGFHAIIILVQLCWVVNGFCQCMQNRKKPDVMWSLLVPLFFMLSMLVFGIGEVICDFCPQWKDLVAPFCRGKEELAYLRRLHSVSEWRAQAFSFERRLPNESIIFLFFHNNLLIVMMCMTSGIVALQAVGIFVFQIQGYRVFYALFWPESDAAMVAMLIVFALSAGGRAVALHIAFSLSPLICQSFSELEKVMDPDKLGYRQLQREYKRFVDAQNRFFDLYSPIWNGYAVGFGVSVPFNLYVLVFHSSQNSALFFCNLLIVSFTFYPLFCVIFPPAWCFATYERMLQRVSMHDHDADVYHQEDGSGCQARNTELMEKTALIHQLTASKPSLTFMNVHTLDYRFLAYYIEVLVMGMLLIQTQTEAG